MINIHPVSKTLIAVLVLSLTFLAGGSFGYEKAKDNLEATFNEALSISIAQAKTYEKTQAERKFMRKRLEDIDCRILPQEGIASTELLEYNTGKLVILPFRDFHGKTYEEMTVMCEMKDAQ